MMKKLAAFLLLLLLVLSITVPVMASGGKNQIKNPGINEEAPSYGELNPDPYQENR